MKGTIKLDDLIKAINATDKTDVYAFKAIDELATRVDETLFKSSKIETRGDFRVACGLDRI